MKQEGIVLYSVDHPIQEDIRKYEKHFRVVLNSLRQVCVPRVSITYVLGWQPHLPKSRLGLRRIFGLMPR